MNLRIYALANLKCTLGAGLSVRATSAGHSASFIAEDNDAVALGCVFLAQRRQKIKREFLLFSVTNVVSAQ